MQVLQKILSKGLLEFGIDDKNPEIERAKNNKPYFKKYKNVFFNISDSGEYLLVAFSDKEVGCDIQIIKPIEEDRLMSLINKVLTEKEKKKFALINESDNKNKSELRVMNNIKVEEFYKYWVMKEALVKKTGEGLSRELNTVEVDGENLEVKTFEKEGQKYFYVVA